MRTVVLLTTLSFLGFHAIALAGDFASDIQQKVKAIDDRYAEAQTAYRESIKNKKADANIVRDAQKERDAKFGELIKEVESIQPDERGFAEYSALTNLYFRTKNWDAVIKNAQAALALKKDVAEIHVELITAFAEKGNLAQAEASLTNGLEQSADKKSILPLHHRLYLLNRRSEKFDQATEHLSLYLPTLRDVKTPYERRSYVQNANELSNLLLEEGDKSRAIPRLDEEITYWKNLDTDDPFTAHEILRKLVNQKIRLLAKLNDGKGATELLTQAREELKSAQKASPDDVPLAIAWGELLDVEAAIAPAEKQTEARAVCLDYFDEQLLKYASRQEVISSYADIYREYGQRLSDEERLDELQALLARYQSAAKKMPADSSKVLLVYSESVLKNLVRRLVVKQKQKELIGKPMFPLETDVWVNGSPQKPEDLKGKVLLLDFWAVWCGPCRATFPHLTEWHEKYKDDGLVVIGLTRYYSYGFDDEKKEHRKEEKLSHEQEVAAVQKFAAHHGLKHRLAYMPEESETSENYAVSGIPHVVVIDRSGIIRLIRVGSGEANARDIEKMIEELIKTKPEGTAANE